MHSTKQLHHFHIPVMGIGFTLETPLKVAKYGIDSVVSIVDDQILETLRSVWAKRYQKSFVAIPESEADARAKRITAYLNFLDERVREEFDQLLHEDFDRCEALHQYFRLLPDDNEMAVWYKQFLPANTTEREVLAAKLKAGMRCGSIDVNIMTKIDGNRQHPDKPEASDALAALRGFALSHLHASVIFSAGMNPALYSYCTHFDDFFPDANGYTKKKIILKVSDYRSAMIQGKWLAKKGLWVHEFRIESGINCGGHAFVSQGKLLGPILEEFKQQRNELDQILRKEYKAAWEQKQRIVADPLPSRITAQGGIGTAEEQQFLLHYYQLDAVGWGSPFLLVPEATTVDGQTRYQLAHSKPDDFYLSNASPLGVPFHNFKPSTSQALRKERIQKERPGSPCYKEFLAFNTDYNHKALCTGSRMYQKLKIAELNVSMVDPELREAAIRQITEKECLCEGLSASVWLHHQTPHPHKLKAVSICPGPNLSWFHGIFSLQEMCDHIYGRTNLLDKRHRPNLFINELQLYLNYWKEHWSLECSSTQKPKDYSMLRNLISGIAYYEQLCMQEQSAFQEMFAFTLVELHTLKADAESILLHE